MDPAIQASIVDIVDLSDGATMRTLDLRGGRGSGVAVVNWGDFVVQFWKFEEQMLGPFDLCEEIGRFTSWVCHGRATAISCTFPIPSDAKWMTISSSPENIEIEWTLS